MSSENFEKVVLEELKALKAGQENLEGKIGGLEDKIGGLEGKIGGLEGKIGGLEGKIGGLEDKIGGLEGKIDGLEGKIDAIGDKLDDIEAKNANRHLEIESKLNALIEDNKSIHEVLGEHEVSIRTLRRRPV